MFTPIVSAVMRRIVFNYFNVADQARARIGAFNQVMTQQSVARESAVKNTVQRFDLVNPFSDKDALTVQILIHVRSRSGVDVNPGLSRVNACQPGTRRTLNAYSNPRLKDAISGNHDPFFRVYDRLI